MARPLSAIALSLTAACAGLASRPSYVGEADRAAGLEGVYAGLAGGGALSVIPGESNFGYSAEGKLGYSFGPPLAVYLSGAVDSASRTLFGRYRVGQVAVFLQHHLLVQRSVMVFARAGIGAGFSKDFTSDHSMAAGLAETGGLGLELAVAPGLYLAPEFFYRNANLNGQLNVQSLGLQLGVAYY
jgi:hypothetical protein